MKRVHESRTNPPGHPHAGEPAVVGASVIRLPPARSDAPSMPLVERARALAMAGERGTATKLFGLAGPEPGGVPPTPGAQTAAITLGGSALPVVSASRQIPQTPAAWNVLVDRGEVVPPPYDPWLLVCAYEESDILPPCIEAMATNIGGFGYELTPFFPKADEEGNPVDPPDGADEEKAEIELFLASLNLQLGFEGLLELVDRDTEITGNGFIEALRDVEGRVAQLEHVPAYTIRLGKLSTPQLVDCPFRHPTSGEMMILRRYRRFRSFVQIREGRVAYFKEYGDPRTINWRTGEYRAAGQSWGLDQAGNSLDGTELIHRRIYSPHTPYGVPRWIGAMPHVRAGRSAAEVLVDWFESAPIGVKIAMVAGGVWRSDSMDAALAKLDDQGRGKENAWSFVTLEASADALRDPLDETRENVPRIAMEDVSGVVPEAVYKGEDSIIEGSSKRVRRQFRLPPIYFGDSQEYSRAAASAGRATAEEQTFVPTRRLRWEVWFNNELLPSMEINFWGLRLKGANTGDDDATFRGLGPFIEGGGASPNQLIRLLAETTGQEYNTIKEAWADKPLPLVLAMLEKGMDPNEPLGDAMAVLKEEEAAQAEVDAAAAADEAKLRFGGGAGGAGAPGGGKPGAGDKGGAPFGKGAPKGKGGPPQRMQATKADEIVGALAVLRASLLREGERMSAEAMDAGWRA